ncbi:MAG: helix-turn-helix domain-containing protein [Actinomycetota bacterium]
MKWSEVGTQPCSIARTLGLLGDGWALLILRDSFYGARKFKDFERGSGAPPNVISNRLKRLVELEILMRVPYQEYPTRHEYRLTDKGRDLYPIFAAILAWGDTYLAGDDGPPVALTHRDCGHPADPTMVCGHCREPLDVRAVSGHFASTEPT